ncbi:NAD(P)-binding domain-containing protein [Hymenobacter cellulosilyticus]|uniref:NAD(P)-binding domain-containing protein n=1 Tax=Hymenobacter cellulosilyticus TaxID=2932248 RepID=UPI0035CAF595
MLDSARFAEPHCRRPDSGSVQHNRAQHLGVRRHGRYARGELLLPADYIYALTGYRPDYSLLEALGVSFQDDAARTPTHDPETFETNRAGLFLAGTVCGGLNTSLWFIENGRHHAAVIASQLTAGS